MQYIDIHTYLPEDILTKVDKASMLVSLESRVPLLDHSLMEFVATIPSSLKLRNGTGKQVLKRALADSLPAELLHRRKMGFGVPLAAWFRHELSEMTRDLLLSPKFRARGLFKPKAVEALIESHASGRDCSPQLWSLICFELWGRQWLDRSQP
jgi:asparagine synthase (glutamine-hydrolysing)